MRYGRFMSLGFLVFLGFAFMTDTIFGQANYDELKMPSFTLPALVPGHGISDDRSEDSFSRAEWEERRAEILQQFANHMFGNRPKTPFNQSYTAKALNHQTFGDNISASEIEINLTCEGRRKTLKVLLFLPEGKSSVPVFVVPNFHGNHTVSHQTDVALPTTWVPNNLEIKDNKPREEHRGIMESRWPISMMCKAGYGIATIYSGDIDEDYDDQFAGGVHQLLGNHASQSSDLHDSKSAKADWGTISAWAWGLSRVMDYLETNPKVDSKRVIVAGHSRLGKTALWAGATDPRFAAVISNNSGCGGAALSRRRIGESVKRINQSFPHWFNQKFKLYNDNEDQCPVDQHMLIALMAPRPVYIASATEDRWADPKGEFLSGKFATPAYRAYSTEGLKITEFPAAETPCHSIIGYHLRTGKHDITEYDWKQYIEFLSIHLK